jgi:hypothetical protein
MYVTVTLPRRSHQELGAIRCNQKAGKRTSNQAIEENSGTLENGYGVVHQEIARFLPN